MLVDKEKCVNGVVKISSGSLAMFGVGLALAIAFIVVDSIMLMSNVLTDDFVRARKVSEIIMTLLFTLWIAGLFVNSLWVNVRAIPEFKARGIAGFSISVQAGRSFFFVTAMFLAFLLNNEVMPISSLRGWVNNGLTIALSQIFVITLGCFLLKLNSVLRQRNIFIKELRRLLQEGKGVAESLEIIESYGIDMFVLEYDKEKIKLILEGVRDDS